MGVTASPMPNPMSTNGPKRSARNVLPDEIWASQASPGAGHEGAGEDEQPRPERGTRHAVTCAPAAIRSVWGKKASPA